MGFSANHAKIAQTSDTIFAGYLDPEQAQDYFAETEKTSIVQQVARKIPMGPSGVSIPHWNGDVSASWIGEGDMKPITKGSLTKQTVVPHKIATIFTASAEVVRANPAGYLNTMRGKVAEAIALAFDSAVLHGTSTPFSAYVDQTNKTIALGPNAYTNLGVTGLGYLVQDGKKWNGTLLDNVAEPILNGSVDSLGRPLFNEAPYTGLNSPYREGSVLGRRSILSDHVASNGVVGYAGDWSQIVWGQVGGLSYSVSSEATLNLGTQESPTLVSMWQHNLVAVLVEAEYGVLINDVNAFLKLTDGPQVFDLTLNGATGGTFTLSLNGLGPTTAIAFGASAATVKAAIVAIDDSVVAADVTVTGSAGVFEITVPGALTANGAALTGGTPAATATVTVA